MNDVTGAGAAAVELTRDLVYAEAPVGWGTPQAGMRALKLDVYAPAGAAGGAARPALILGHGGAYHRGSKEEELFEQDGFRNTAVAEYCRRFAERGHVCFSVGYRLTQELPAPQPRPIKRERGSVSRGRIDYVRELMGLPPATDRELLDGVEAVIADMASAFRFVQEQAPRWSVDPARIAIGGFSAGAFSAAYAAYALGVPAAAVICLSGGMEADDAAHYIRPGQGQPPALLFSSEFDLPGIAERALALARAATAAGLGVRRYFVPGRPHFYDRDTEVVLQDASLDGAEARCSVERAIEDFLRRTLGSPAA